MQGFNLDEALDTARTKVAEAAADIDMITMNIRMAGAMTAQVGHSIHEALKDAELSRQAVAKADNDNVVLLQKINAIALDAEGKEKEPGQLTADETQQLTALRADQEAKTTERVALFNELRQLRMEIDEMLGHTADAKAEEASRNFILACISEIIEFKDDKVTKVIKRVWDSIEQMFAETDSNLMQRVIYEYMTFSAGLPSEWGDDAPATPATGEGQDATPKATA